MKADGSKPRSVPRWIISCDAGRSATHRQANCTGARKGPIKMRVLIAPSGFKETLSAEAVASAIGRGVRAAAQGIDTIELPLVDGGEGFAATLARTTGGTLHPVSVTGPVGDPVAAHVGILGGDGPRTAVIDMASAPAWCSCRATAATP